MVDEKGIQPVGFDAVSQNWSKLSMPIFIESVANVEEQPSERVTKYMVLLIGDMDKESVVIPCGLHVKL